MALVYANPIVPNDPARTQESTTMGEEKNLITALNGTLHEILAADERATVFGEDVADPKGGVFKTTVGLTKAFGNNRSFNMPLAESLIVGTAVGDRRRWRSPLAERSSSPTSSTRRLTRSCPRSLDFIYRTAGGWGLSDRDPGAVRRRHPQGALSQPVDRGVLHPHSRAQGRRAFDTR